MSFLSAVADHFHQGRWPMWPILGLFVACWAIIIERIMFLRSAAIDKEKLLPLLKSQIMGGNVQGAIKVCSGNPTPLTRIIMAGLTKFNRPDEEVQAAMDEAALDEMPLLERRTGFLAMLGNVATLVGLLGTIIGLIDAFAGIAGVDASTKAALLSNGIAEAMNCTAAGLITAVPALLAYAFLTNWTQTMTDDINACSVKIVNLVIAHRKAMKVAA
jgi:biopolymer transport protein ExbB/TolQ